MTQATDLPGGFVGPLADTVPLLQEPMVRPYLVAIVLHRGAVRLGELIAALTPHLPISDQQVGGWDWRDKDYHDSDNTRAERLCLDVLAEFVSRGWLRYNESQDFWEALPNSYWLTMAASLDGQLPRVLSAKYLT